MEGTSTEPVKSNDIESRILELCGENSAGISDSSLQTALPNIAPLQRVSSLNQLITQGKIEIFKRKGSILYKLKDQSNIKNCQGADNEEKIILQIIEKAKDKGIWIRDIRTQSSLALSQLNKILKSLENKKLIKCVKPVNASKKKIYMLYTLEPDCTITGGAWYSDQEFEAEFVEVLNVQCIRFLQQANQAAQCVDPVVSRTASSKSLKEVWQYINGLGISKVSLKKEDIETILNSLVYDDKVTVVPSIRGDKEENLYRVKKSLVSCAPLAKIPCGSCRLLNDCMEGGIISPSTCVYMKEWLSTNF